MELQTKVNIPVSDWKIAPCEQMLFVGSCFADNLGRRFQTEKFRATVTSPRCDVQPGQHSPHRGAVQG